MYQRTVNCCGLLFISVDNGLSILNKVIFMHINQVISVFLTLCFAVGSSASSSAVKQQINGINQLTFQDVNIPVYFPTFLPAVHSEDGESTEYLFAVTTSSETYDIEIYDISSQGSTEDKPDITRLPLSCKVGSVYGSHYPKSDLDIALPEILEERTECRELLPNLDAQIAEDGTSVSWVDTGWDFIFCGSSGHWSELQQFAARWKEITPIVPQGTVCIYPKSIFFMWSDVNCHYCYEAYQMDLLSALTVFDSFQRITAE